MQAAFPETEREILFDRRQSEADDSDTRIDAQFAELDESHSHDIDMELYTDIPSPVIQISEMPIVPDFEGSRYRSHSVASSNEREESECMNLFNFKSFITVLCHEKKFVPYCIVQFSVFCWY